MHVEVTSSESSGSSRLSLRSGWHFPAVVLLLATLGFAINYYVAHELDQRRAFNDWNTVFGSDPNWYLPRLADGIYSSKRHPLLNVFVYPPVWTGAKLLSAATDVEERRIRRQLTILGTPLGGALKTVGLLLLAAQIGIRLRFAVLIALIDIASVSRLVFGSIPESFGATATVLTWTFYLAAKAMNSAGLIRYRSWFVCGLIGFGVSITNIVPFGILLLAAQRPDLCGWQKSARRCASLAGAVCLTGIFLHFASISAGRSSDTDPAAFRPDSGSLATSRPVEPAAKWDDLFRWVTPFIRFRPIETFLALPVTVTSTFVAPAPGAMIRPLRGGGDSVQAPAMLSLPRELTGEWLFLFALVVMNLGLGTYGYFQGADWVRSLGLATIGVVLFNGALFLVWGTSELFIFTLHWQPCLLVLLAGSGFVRGISGRLAVAASAGLLGVEILWNVRFLRFVFDVL